VCFSGFKIRDQLVCGVFKCHLCHCHGVIFLFTLKCHYLMTIQHNTTIICVYYAFIDHCIRFSSEVVYEIASREVIGWHSFIHYRDLYSAPSRLLLRSAPDPCTTKKKSFGWLVNYFHQRGHITNYQGFMSRLAHINASIVQGSVIGPRLM